MKTNSIFYLSIIILILNSCKKIEIGNSTITTLAVTNIIVNSAIGGGEITSNGSLPVLDRGVCWSFKPNPTISDSHSSDGNGFGLFSSNLDNLNGDSTYYLRAYYININDTVYGNQVKFTTPNYIVFNPTLTYGSVTDIDGNVYKTITIGTQTWMAENLKVTHYRNGDVIPNETDPQKWAWNLSNTGAYCWYKNDILSKNIYGAYYNWYAATDTRNIAPSGWHVASSDEWKVLCNFLFIDFNPSPSSDKRYPYKLRETTSAHWKDIQLEPVATNESGFTALPAGRDLTLSINRWTDGYETYFWTQSGTVDWPVCVYLSNYIMIFNYETHWGYNIRCVKD